MVLAVVLVGAPAQAAPATRFQMPFPCGQEWTGKTRASHSPSPRAVDWNRPDDAGDEVVAAAPGVVTRVSSSGGYGRMVQVEHVAGETSVYAHLASVAVSRGQALDQGALVGTVGRSGNATGTHLHFEERSARGRVGSPFFDGLKFVFGSTLASRNCVDVPIAGNFVVGRRAEVGVFRRMEVAQFRIDRPDRRPKVIRLGTSTDQPVVGDWDGNRRANAGVRTPETRTFTLLSTLGIQTIRFGGVADLPIAGDWDGDGVWEVGVVKAGTSRFRLRAADGTVRPVFLGDPDDLPVTGDWDGDRRTDLGVYGPTVKTAMLAAGGSLGFLFALGSQGIHWDYALALLAGGVIAAPIAAWLVRHLAARVLGVAAGGLIILTNSKTIAEALGASGGTVATIAIVVAVLWITGIVLAVRQERRSRVVAELEEQLAAA
jgi:hypothetical protein